MGYYGRHKYVFIQKCSRAGKKIMNDSDNFSIYLTRKALMGVPACAKIGLLEKYREMHGVMA